MESRQYFLDQNTGLSYAIVPEVQGYLNMFYYVFINMNIFPSLEHLILFKHWLR